MPLADAPIAHLRTPEEAAQWLRQRGRGQQRPLMGVGAIVARQ